MKTNQKTNAELITELILLTSKWCVFDSDLCRIQEIIANLKVNETTTDILLLIFQKFFRAGLFANHLHENKLIVVLAILKRLPKLKHFKEAYLLCSAAHNPDNKKIRKALAEICNVSEKKFICRCEFIPPLIPHYDNKIDPCCLFHGTNAKPKKEYLTAFISVAEKHHLSISY